MPLKKIHHARLRRLVREKLSNGQIAQRMGVHRTTIIRARKRLGIEASTHPAHWPKSKPRTVTPEERRELIELVSQGLCDAEIAPILGITKQCVCSRRHILGIASQWRPQARRVAVGCFLPATPTPDQWMELRLAGRSFEDFSIGRESYLAFFPPPAMHNGSSMGYAAE